MALSRALHLKEVMALVPKIPGVWFQRESLQALLALALTAGSVNAFAGSDHDHSDHSNNHSSHHSSESSQPVSENKKNGAAHGYASHVHGLSELMVAVEDARIEIQFHSPAMNLIGFERRAQSPDEQKKLTQLKNQLEQPDALFTFSGNDKTSCRVINIAIDLGHLMPEQNAASEHKHEHADHHETEGHHKDHSGSAPHSVNHSEVAAHYVFDCDKASPIDNISVDLFRPFPGIQKIYSVWVNAGQQGFIELTTKNNNLSFVE